MKVRRILACLMLATLFCGTLIAQPSNAKQLQSLLKKVTERGIMYGHQDDPVYGHAWKWEEGRSDVKESCGDYPAVMGFDLGYIELGKPENLDGVPFNRMRQEICNHYQRGGIVTLSWHSTNPLIEHGTAWIEGIKNGTDEQKAQFGREQQTVASILPGGECHQKFEGWLDRLSDFLLSLRTTDGQLIPVIFRPWHEHTGSWFWWGEDLCTVQQYKDLWRMTIEHLQKRGVTNAVFAYSPGSEYVSKRYNTMESSTEKYLERYPGDEYIDLMGLDTYCMAPEGPRQQAQLQQFGQSLSELLKVMCNVAKTHDKIAALTETGFESIPNSNWWMGTLLPAIEQYPLAYVLTWRNAHDKPKHFYAPYKGFENVKDFQSFYKSKKTLFAKDIK